jgi:hypothetical protein
MGVFVPKPPAGETLPPPQPLQLCLSVSLKVPLRQVGLQEILCLFG